MPYTMLPELAKYSDEVLSGPELAAENMHIQYTMRDPSTPVFKRVLLSQLTPALGMYISRTPNVSANPISAGHTCNA